jgi:hypothetical protein
VSTCIAQVNSVAKKNISEKKIQLFALDIGGSNSKVYFGEIHLGLNLKTQKNWNLNFEYNRFLNDDLYPLTINSYLISDVSLRFGKLYRKGIWLYGANIGPSYVLKNKVNNLSNIFDPEYETKTTIGLSPKITLIVAPLSWLGMGVSYNYNFNSIQTTNMLWLSLYIGRVRFKLKKYQINYQKL